ncbi:MAG: FliA/WhiG family RNA polymerase sigma factor [Myxococcota bacterium]|nr:FliA/WhiG family RNA polymerase sigma factor [Myxococcota bacterium]
MNNAERQKLILDYYPLVRQIAFRMAKRFPSHIDVEDLIHIGTLGLIEAIDRYQPDKVPSFSTYARSRIQGSILDEMRQHDWVPRSVRDRSNKISLAQKELKRRLNRVPEPTEVAEFLGVSVERYREMQRKSDIRVVLSMEEGADEDYRLGDTIADKSQGDPLSSTLAFEEAEQLKKHLGLLPPREQQIITMYYFKELTFKEIAKILGLTESRISQLHTSIKNKLKNLMLTNNG